MSETEESIPQRIIPLSERVLTMMSKVPQWDFKVVKAFFPQEHEKALYRAIDTLVAEGKINYLGWQGRSKQYTTRGISNLPTFATPDGQRHDIKTLFPLIPEQYKTGLIPGLEELNEFWLTVGQLFIIAQIDDEQEMLAQYKELILKLDKMRRILNVHLGYIESLQKHSIMSGDLKIFKAILTGDSPDQEQIAAFKVWLSRFRRGEFS